MKSLILAACLLFSFTFPCSAQDLDPQVRFLVHGHFFDPGSRVGITTWTIKPDITHQGFDTDNQQRTLFVLGLVLRSKAGTNDYNWLEVMPGVLIETDPATRVTKTHRLLNTRAYAKWPGIDLYLENHWRADRLLFSTFATRPFQIAGIHGRYGAETEMVVSLDDKVKSVFQIGPRLSIRLPVSWLNVATVLYVNQTADLVWRTYIKFGK